jgi:hypothetical protein
MSITIIFLAWLWSGQLGFIPNKAGIFLSFCPDRFRAHSASYQMCTRGPFLRQTCQNVKLVAHIHLVPRWSLISAFQIYLHGVMLRYRGNSKFIIIITLVSSSQLLCFINFLYYRMYNVLGFDRCMYIKF